METEKATHDAKWFGIHRGNLLAVLSKGVNSGKRNCKRETEREEDYLQNLHKVSQHKSVPCTGLPVVASNDYMNAGKRVTCLFFARQPPAGHGLLILEVSRSHTTHHTR